MLKKKSITFLTLGAIAMPSLLVIACDSQKVIYKVIIDNAKDKNYVVSTQDINYQPITFKKDKFIFWDILASYKDAKYKAQFDKFFGKDADKVNTSIKDKKEYTNGLEWLLYEIFISKDKKIDLQIGVTSGALFKIPKKTMQAANTKKASAIKRANYLKTNVAEFVKTFKAVKLVKYNESAGAFEESLLTNEIVTDRVDAMLKKVN